MTAAVVAAGRRYLPRGWGHFGLQLVIWFGFLVAYQIARGLADRRPDARLRERAPRHRPRSRRTRTALIELTFQRFADHRRTCSSRCRRGRTGTRSSRSSASRCSGSTCAGTSAFARFRNTILLANVIGLIGYVLVPTAPPRMFPRLGFVDTLGDIGGLNHGSGLIQLAANPYAAMPSLHAARRADRRRDARVVCKNWFREGALAALAGLGVVHA